MIELRISAEEAHLLRINAETRDLATRLLRDDAVGQFIFVVGTVDEIDGLRDACSDLLLRIGFDEDYAATPEGTTLEGLIDKFYLG